MTLKPGLKLRVGFCWAEKEGKREFQADTRADRKAVGWLQLPSRADSVCESLGVSLYSIFTCCLPSTFFLALIVVILVWSWNFWFPHLVPGIGGLIGW